MRSLRRCSNDEAKETSAWIDGAINQKVPVDASISWWLEAKRETWPALVASQIPRMNRSRLGSLKRVSDVEFK